MSGIKHKKDSRDAESPTAPDSTTKEKASFMIGDEVLMKRKDGNFYLGTVVEVDTIREQCLVKFGDNTESWSTVKHLTKLSTGYDEVMCVMCKRSQPKPNNEIVVCDRCSRGYHQLCHQPMISSECMGSGTYWQCRRCQVPLIKELRAYRKKAVQPPSTPKSPPAPVVPLSPQDPPKIPKLPYDLKNLVWDLQHKVNSEQKYCYCGSRGDWYIKMLQCLRCRQWFHEHCISCLQYPLYLGDRFYLFVCAVCNFGVEFIRRLELNWLDLVHLALFNMTVFRAQKYHEVDEDILYFINGNWATLQLPPKIYDVQLEERRKIILNVLLKNSKRFKCGREVKKRATLWALRLRIPPQSPTVHSLPDISHSLAEKDLLESWSRLKPEVKFLPCTNGPAPQPIKTDLQPPQNGKVPNGSVWDTYPLITKSCPESLAGIRLLHIDTRPILLPKGMPATGHKSQKISQELPPTPPSSLSAPPEVPQLDSSSTTTVPSAIITPITSGETSSSDDASSRGTLDSFIPPPKDFEGKNNPFRSVAELLGSSTPPNPPITLPLPLTPVITQPMLRPTKRRLSEKDIRIDRNGEVKRRRLRRQCTSNAANINVETLPCASWNSAKSLRNMYNPTSSANSLDSAINGRRIRRSLKQKPSASVTPTSSPIKNSPSVSLNDLKNSVNIYFGAANRIASGEKFRIKAKRITPQGRTQYLIEWENPVT